MALEESKFKPGFISVIVPVYNGKKSLAKCIESLIRQSYEKFEVLLVDDGSTDGSSLLCDELASQDKRIIAIHQKNSGPAAARNTGIERSQGEFIFFVDSDDSLERDALETLYETYRQHRSDITIGNFRKVGSTIISSGHETFFVTSQRLEKEGILQYVRRYIQTPYLYTLFVHCWGKLYLSRIIKHHGLFFNTALHNFEDVAFNFSYLNHCDCVYFTTHVLYNYTIPHEQETQSFRIGNNVLHFRRYYEAFDMVRLYLEKNDPGIDAWTRAKHLYLSCIIIMLIRTCGRENPTNRQSIRTLVSAVVKDPYVRQSLACYTPSHKDSRLMPLLIKLKLNRLIILVGHYKYRKHRKPRKFE